MKESERPGIMLQVIGMKKPDLVNSLYSQEYTLTLECHTSAFSLSEEREDSCYFFCDSGVFRSH